MKKLLTESDDSVIISFVAAKTADEQNEKVQKIILDCLYIICYYDVRCENESNKSNKSTEKST